MSVVLPVGSPATCRGLPGVVGRLACQPDPLLSSPGDGDRGTCPGPGARSGSPSSGSGGRPASAFCGAVAGPTPGESGHDGSAPGPGSCLASSRSSFTALPYPDTGAPGTLTSM